MSSRTTLVTGGAGFIGSHLADRLVQDGYRTVVVDNLTTGQRANVHGDAVFYEVDIASPRLAKVFKQERPELVFHLAAQASVVRSVERPDIDAKANVLGTVNVVRQCLAAGVQRLIVTSTGGAIYGEPVRLPCDESHPIQPLSPYGASKYAAEVMTECLAKLHGLSYTILRYGNVFGPRQDPSGEAGVVAIFSLRMLNNQEVTLYGHGTPERDYTYVSDIVEANLRTLHEHDNDVYNIGTGAGTTVQTIFDRLAALTGYKKTPVYAPLRKGEVQNIYLDVTKARRKLGWRAAVGLTDGLTRALEFFRAQAMAKAS